MVLDDISYDSKPASTETITDAATTALTLEAPVETRLAAPIDRFAAVVADLIVFLPIVSLVVSPIRRLALEAQMRGETESYGYAMMGAAGLGIVAWIIYQTACVTVWGATPGKRVLGLRIENLWKPEIHPSKQDAFVRSISWCLEILFLGIPWISIFSNERRRPFHDRLADTVVVSVRQSRRKGLGAVAGPPSLNEIAIASGLYVAVLTAFFVVLLAQMWKMQKLAGDESTQVVTELEEQGALCASVGDSKRGWIVPDGQPTPSRLTVALTLFATDSIDTTCLRSESEFAFWHDEQKTLAYLAKGLSEPAGSTLTETYFDKVCELDADSEACAVARLEKSRASFADDDDETDPTVDKVAAVARETEVEEILARIDSSSAPYVRVWGIRHLMEARHFTSALGLIDGLSVHPNLGSFLASERSKALWGLERRDDARVSMRASIDALDFTHRVELARWFCFQETSETGCSEQSRSACSLLNAAVDHDNEWLEHPPVLTAYLRGQNCSGGLTTENLSALEKRVSDEPSTSLIRALAKMSESKTDEAKKLLSQIFIDDERTSAVILEAGSRLLELTTQKPDLVSIQMAWQSTPATEEGWDQMGCRLMEKFNTLKAWDQSIEVGLKMADYDLVDRSAARSLVVASYRAGHTRMALSFLENAVKREVESKLARQMKLLDLDSEKNRHPASIDGFDEVVRELTSPKAAAKRGGS